MDDFEVLSSDEMRRKYGLFKENRPTLCLDPQNVPAALRGLIPLAEKFGISDDLIRADYLGSVSVEELSELRQLMSENDDRLDEWLAGPEAEGPSFSEEYVAFTCLRMAYDESDTIRS